MAPAKQYVYAVIRRDYDHHTDRKGVLVLHEIHANESSATAAAKSHFHKESAKSVDGDGEPEERTAKDGSYEAQCWTRQDKRDNFIVSVKKTELKGSFETASNGESSSAAASKSKTLTKRPKPEPEDDEDDEEGEEAAPAAKKPATKKAAAKSSEKSSIPEGKAGVLKGMKLLFTGTFDSMDRNASIATAETYGGKIVKKLEDADWIVLGVKAGPKKLEEIEQKGLRTMDEATFLNLLKTGNKPS